MRQQARVRALTAERESAKRRPPHSSGSLPRRPFWYALVATLGVGLGLSVLSALSTLATVFTYVGIALFLSVAADPAVQFAVSKGMRRGAAVLALVGLSLAGTAAIATAVIPTASAQIALAIQHLVAFLGRLPEQEWFQWLVHNVPGAGIDANALLSQVAAFLSNPDHLMSLGGGLLHVGLGAVDAVTAIVVVSVLTIYFLAVLPRVKAKAYQLVPRSKRFDVSGLTEDILLSIGRYVGGQLALATINAAFTFVLTSICGSPAPMLLAVVAFIGALIPVVGPVLGTTIAVLMTLTVNPVAAVTVAIVMLVYMQVEAYLLTPKIMSRAVAVPGPLVIIAALGGAALGGVLGALVAVPIAAAGLLIVERIVIPRLERS